MAVHAQYPSNVLLLNRSGQEGHEYSLQPQPGGFLDQSHMLFNNGGSANPRKRGRELASIGGGGGITTTTTTTTNTNFNPLFSMQTQPPSTQLIDLSLLHNNVTTTTNNHHNQQQQQPNVVSTGLHLSFGDQQLQQHNHRHYQQQQNSLPSQSSALFSLLSEDFATQIKRQRDEVDQFLQAQGELLRRTLAEKRQRHQRALLGAAEEALARRLKEKEAEVEKATRRHAELEARAAQLSVEAQVWQAKARAQEATAASLQAQLQQAIISGGLTQESRRVDDGQGSAGGGVEGQAEDAESAYVDPDRVTVTSGPSCKACRTRIASVVLLPCRHLSVCTECDQVAQACPVCFQVRSSGVEVCMY